MHFYKSTKRYQEKVKTEQDNGNLLHIQLLTNNVIKCLLSCQHCWE